MEEHNSKVNTTSSSNIISSIHLSQTAQICTVENLITIWLGLESEVSNEDTINRLQSCVNSIEVFIDSDECIDFLTNIKEEKVFLIISDYFAQNILHLIDEIDQIHRIYILSYGQTELEYWTNVSKKVEGIFIDIELLSNTLEQAIRRADNDMTPINIIPPSTTTRLDELNPSFMYSQLLKEIILDIEFDEKAKHTFTNYCRQQYVDNNAMLNKIDEFEQTYDRSNASWWYTKEPFIYSVLNKALRTQDIETTVMMGFFIRDLHQQIEQLHSEIQQPTKMILYRGQGLSITVLETIKNSIGGLFSFNNFLSTSGDFQVSYMLADSVRDNPGVVGILFQIEIDSFTSPIPFASLKDLSYYRNAEKEFLFSMHTVFRIDEITEIEDRLWQVTLLSTNDTDQQLKCLSDYMRNELKGETAWHRMVKLMSKIGKTQLCINTYIMLLDATPDNALQDYTTLIIDTLNYAIKACCLTALMKTAPFEMNVALPVVEETSLVNNQSELGIIFNNLGKPHHWMKDYENAIWCCEKILKIRQKLFPTNYQDLAKIYNEIGKKYHLMEVYPTALSYFHQALETLQKLFPSDDPEVASIYSNIGMVYQSMEDYQNALLSYKKTLDIRLKSLPSNHPDLATTYNNIGELYEFIGDRSTALVYFKEAVAIQAKSLPDHHSDRMVTAVKMLGVSEPADLSTTISMMNNFEMHDE